MSDDRVAVVVVHGIADQKPGQTVREVARLLCHGGEGEPRYVHGEMHDLLIPVEKLAPGDDAADAPVDAKGKASVRRKPGSPSGFYQTQQWSSVEHMKATDAPADAEPAQDLGMAMNDYLLGRLELSQSDALYE